MTLRKRIAVTAVCAVIAGTCPIASADNYDVNIQLDGFTSRQVSKVQFGEVKPILADDVTYVPVRAFAESAGMEISWDQPTQTAIITLHANKSSDKPIEKYASELINQVGGYGLDLKPSSITAALKLYSKDAVLRFNFEDTDGDIVAIGKKIEMTHTARLINDASLVIPIRNAMEIFGLNITWHQETLTAEVSIPNDAAVPSGLKIIANHHSPETDGSDYTSPAVQDDRKTGVIGEGDSSHGKYIGRFKVTLYCPCDICNGGWGAHTAWADEIKPGQTIAVDPDIIGKLTWVYIDGVGLRRAEDCGGAVKGYHIDLAVPSHDEVINGQVTYRDVYYADEDF